MSHPQTPPPSASPLLTEQLMEGGSDRAVPLTLEECQPCWGHGILMLSVEVKCTKGSHLQAVAGNKTQAPGESPCSSTMLHITPGHMKKVEKKATKRKFPSVSSSMHISGQDKPLSNSLFCNNGTLQCWDCGCRGDTNPKQPWRTLQSDRSCSSSAVTGTQTPQAAAAKPSSAVSRGITTVLAERPG